MHDGVELIIIKTKSNKLNNNRKSAHIVVWFTISSRFCELYHVLPYDGVATEGNTSFT